MSKLQISIIEDNPLFLNKINSLLQSRSDIKEIRTFCDGESFLNLKNYPFDLLIFDYKLPGMDGVEILGHPKIRNLNVPKLILTGFNMEEKIIEAMKRGVTGYLFKEEIQQLNSIINILLNNGSYITPTLALRIAYYFQNIEARNIKGIDKLTKRENEILELLRKGLIDSKVADLLDISVYTVRQHIKNIYKKMEVTSRYELLSLVNTKI